MVAETQTGSIRDFPAYLHFTPRPDQPDKFDEQTAFYNCNSDGCIFLTGGNGAGCLAAEQLIYDPIKAVSLPVSEIAEDFHVIARNIHGNAVIAKAEKPRIYGTEDLYDIGMSSGQFMRVTLGHRLLTRAGWREIGGIVHDDARLSFQSLQHSQQDRVASDDVKPSDDHTQEVQLSDTSIGRHCEVHPEETKASVCLGHKTYALHPERDLDHAFARLLTCPSAFQQCEWRSLHKPSGFLGYCCQGLHHDDEQPHQQSITGLTALRPQGDADAHNHCLQQKDDLACRSEHTHDDPRVPRPSTHHCVRPERLYHVEPYSFSEPCLLPCWMDNNSHQCAESNMVATQRTTAGQQSPEGIFRNCTTTSSLQSAKVFVESACEILSGVTKCNPAYITSIQFVRRDVYWDFHVPEYENYWMAGVWNHNTTSCLIAKICRFVLETPPPRRDTPFWVIAETYEQIGSMFDEKFNQQGHLPASVIDWPRIHWNNRNNNQPFRVPLKSPPGHTGKNWSLEFKSWRQGRGKMQARSLGGFGFIEQFPWGIFEEVLRGCREYNFPGSKMVEFTPVDADLSQNLEEMIENGYEPETPAPGLSYLPKNWKIFHANTLCAMEAGHVDKRWFEEFFGMVPKDMLETRLKGMFSTFEGVIYKDFNVGTHCMGDEMWGRIKNCYHRRGIDWGAGPENDFVCEWGAKNGLGQWFIYDEEVSNDQSKTTVDHLTDVYHRWEWPEDNSMYGVTYADPSSPDNIRIAGKLNQYNPSVENLSMQRGKNSVLEGIEHIQYLLKPQIPVPMLDAQGKPIMDPETGKCAVKLEPKLFIHRTNCPKLIQQMKSYRWLRGSDPTMKLSRNPRDPLRAPLKKNDHCCLAGDVMVLMADGTEKPIRYIRVGDIVASHRGTTRVVAAKCTGFENTISFRGNSREIRCTANHPWYDFANGVYSPLNRIVTLCRLNSITIDQEHLSKPLHGKDTNGAGIQSRNTSPSDSTFEDRNEPKMNHCDTSGCTKKSGKQHMGTFQKGTTSTISTKTPQTITSRTCKPLPGVITQNCISIISTRPLRQRQNGIEAKRGEHGTNNTPRMWQQHSRLENEHASIARSNTKPQRTAAPLNTVRTHVEPTLEKQQNVTMSHDNASSANRSSSWINTRRFLPVLQHVSAFECQLLPSSAEPENVYNLATEDGTFFADGILTSNCDALRYVCFSDDFMTGSTISSAKNHSALTSQLHGEYIPRQGLRGFTTQHRDRG